MNTNFILLMLIFGGLAYNVGAQAMLDSQNLSTKAHLSQTPLPKKQLQILSQSTDWQRLLLVNNSNKDLATSQIKDAQFFLSHSDNGKISLIDEITALHFALTQNDVATICRFPARSYWLANQLSLTLPMCADFENWQLKNTSRLSLIFAEEHPNHLPSAFAHTLLRADTDTDVWAINYTIAQNQQVGVKSLTGGYAGVMQILPFTKKDEDYRQTHKRDVWQYSLDLPADDIAQIMRHIYEVKDMNRKYRFTHENCATEIVRLIDLVNPSQNLSKTTHITTPAEIARLLDNNGFVKSVQYLPSVSSVREFNQSFSNSFNKRANQSDMNIVLPSSPLQGTPTHRFGIHQTFAQNSPHASNKPQTNISFRTAYRDVLDKQAGVRQYLDLTLLSAQIAIDDKVKLNDLTVFSQRAYNPINTQKAYFGRATGRHLKIKRQADFLGDNNTHTVVHLSKEWGKSWVFGQKKSPYALSDTLCYVFGAGMGEFGRIRHGYRLGVSLNSGCIYDVSDDFRMVGELSLPVWYQGNFTNNDAKNNHAKNSYITPKLMLGMQYDLNQKNAIRLQSAHEWGFSKPINSVNIGYLRYFD